MNRMAKVLKHCETIMKEGTRLFRSRIDENGEIAQANALYKEITVSYPSLSGENHFRQLKDSGLWKDQDYHTWLKKTKIRLENDFEGFDGENSMAPDPFKVPVKDGRYNPSGVSYLYTAKEKETAFAEVRPMIKDYISIAEIQACRDLKLVDLHSQDRQKKENERLFSMVQNQFAKINRGDPQAYLVTQYLTAIVQRMGYDGLIYASAVTAEGTNCVIFNGASCCPVSSRLYAVEHVEYHMRCCFY